MILKTQTFLLSAFIFFRLIRISEFLPIGLKSLAFFKEKFGGCTIFFASSMQEIHSWIEDFEYRQVFLSIALFAFRLVLFRMHGKE